MTRTPDVDAAMNRYLRRLRWGLSSLSEDDRQEIVREVESHLIDRLGPSPSADALQAELERLGPPEAYARRFIESFGLSAALASGSPWHLMRQLLRLAGGGVVTTLSGAGLLVLLLFSASFMALPVFKLIWPQNVGVWLGPQPSAFAAGFLAHPPAGGREVLGYWIIPAAAVLGIALFRVTIALMRVFLVTLRDAAERRAGGAR